jgi:hypothetical protein
MPFSYLSPLRLLTSDLLALQQLDVIGLLGYERSIYPLSPHNSS